jgi:hypothetical protein
METPSSTPSETPDSIHLSYDCARGRHFTVSRREHSGLTTTCGCLFGFVCSKKKAHVAGET